MFKLIHTFAFTTLHKETPVFICYDYNNLNKLNYFPLKNTHLNFLKCKMKKTYSIRNKLQDRRCDILNSVGVVQTSNDIYNLKITVNTCRRIQLFTYCGWMGGCVWMRVKDVCAGKAPAMVHGKRLRYLSWFRPQKTKWLRQQLSHWAFSTDGLAQM